MPRSIEKCPLCNVASVDSSVHVPCRPLDMQSLFRTPLRQHWSLLCPLNAALRSRQRVRDDVTPGRVADTLTRIAGIHRVEIICPRSRWCSLIRRRIWRTHHSLKRITGPGRGWRRRRHWSRNLVCWAGRGQLLLVLLCIIIVCISCSGVNKSRAPV